MCRKDFITAAAVILAAIIVNAAHAGIADSPLPVLVSGVTTYHLYSVPGIRSTGGLGTFFACTSTDTVTMKVGVETFGNVGGLPWNDAAATSLDVPPGQTVTFGCGPAAAFTVHSSVGCSSGGSARILATSKKLICTAFVADDGNIPPTSAWQLTIIAKLKQKAAN